jgi:hypothetical protein
MSKSRGISICDAIKIEESNGTVLFSLFVPFSTIECAASPHQDGRKVHLHVKTDKDLLLCELRRGIVYEVAQLSQTFPLPPQLRPHRETCAVIHKQRSDSGGVISNFFTHLLSLISTFSDQADHMIGLYNKRFIETAIVFITITTHAIQFNITDSSIISNLSSVNWND